MPLDHDFFMREAEEAAKQSTCIRGHTAAIIVRDRRPISIGYNGAPPGMKHCTDVGACEPDAQLVMRLEHQGHDHFASVYAALEQMGCQRSIHAELNAIAWAARAGMETEGCAIYTLSAPCLRCAQAIIAAGIDELYYRKDYRADRLDLIDRANIPILRV